MHTIFKSMIAEEVVKIEERKDKIDDELKEVQVSFKKRKHFKSHLHF